MGVVEEYNSVRYTRLGLVSYRSTPSPSDAPGTSDIPPGDDVKLWVSWDSRDPVVVIRTGDGGRSEWTVEDGESPTETSVSRSDGHHR